MATCLRTNCGFKGQMLVFLNAECIVVCLKACFRSCWIIARNFSFVIFVRLADHIVELFSMIMLETLKNSYIKRLKKVCKFQRLVCGVHTCLRSRYRGICTHPYSRISLVLAPQQHSGLNQASFEASLSSRAAR